MNFIQFGLFFTVQIILTIKIPIMKKLCMMFFSVVFITIISCGDSKKEQEELDATLDKIEAVEKEIDETTEELDNKAEEVESALSELDSL